MSEVSIPTPEELKIWAAALSRLPELGAYLPIIDDAWFIEMRSCLEAAMLHPKSKLDICHAGAAIFYEVTKNHYRIDGNKRSAVITTYLFFVINGCRLRIEWEDLYELAKTVAMSEKNVDSVVEAIYPAFLTSCDRNAFEPKS